MITMVIGEEGEYALRLRKYLEEYWRGPKRILIFTSVEAFLHAEEKGDCYLLGEQFFAQLQAADAHKPEINEKNLLVLSDREKEGWHCRYHSPSELLALLEEKSRLFGEEVRLHKEKGTLTMLYSPVYDQDLLSIAMTFLKPGDLFLDMEDIGEVKGPGEGTQQEGNMEDLCYYINLREKTILRKIKEMRRQQEEVYVIDAPPAYLSFLEIGKEDYQWFFQQLRQSGEYGEICLGVGSGVFAHLYPLGIADRLILLDTRKNKKQHAFCHCLEQALQKEETFRTGQFKRVYREDVFLEKF